METPSAEQVELSVIPNSNQSITIHVLLEHLQPDKLFLHATRDQRSNLDQCIVRYSSLISISTFMASRVYYTFRRGWFIGNGVNVMLLCHAVGHYVWLRRQNVRPSAINFNPYLGAAVISPSFGKNVAAGQKRNFQSS
jgi:hypothetical protein